MMDIIEEENRENYSPAGAYAITSFLEIIIGLVLGAFNLFTSPFLIGAYLIITGITIFKTINEFNILIKYFQLEDKITFIKNSEISFNDYIEKDSESLMCVKEKTAELIKNSVPPINSRNIDKVPLTELKIIKANILDYIALSPELESVDSNLNKKLIKELIAKRRFLTFKDN